MQECIFCQIVAGKVPTEKVWEDEELMAFRDIAPKAPQHVLLIPKQHSIDSLAKLDRRHAPLLGRLMLAVPQVARKLGIEQAFQVKIYSGKGAGQTVFHLHIHILGGWKEKQKH